MNNKFVVYISKAKYFILTLFVFIALYLIYVYTPLLSIKDIRLTSIGKENIEFLDSEKLMEIVDSYKNKKYLESDPEEIKKKVEEFSFFIKSVIVFKELPGTIKIDILERVPFLSLKIDSKCYLLDNENFVLDILSENCQEISKKYETLYVVSDDPKIQFIKGEYSSFHQIEKITQTMKILNEYSFGVSDVSIADNIALFKIDGSKSIKVSFNQDVPTQLVRLVAVFNELGKKNYNYRIIDVRPERPTIK